MFRQDERERVKAAGARVMSMDQIEGLEPIHENWGDVDLGESRTAVLYYHITTFITAVAPTNIPISMIYDADMLPSVLVRGGAR